MKKRIIRITLLYCMMLTLVACGNRKTNVPNGVIDINDGINEDDYTWGADGSIPDDDYSDDTNYNEPLVIEDMTNNDPNNIQIQDMVFNCGMDINSVVEKIMSSKANIRDFKFTADSSTGKGLECTNIYEMQDVLNKFTDAMCPYISFYIDGAYVSMLFYTNWYDSEIYQVNEIWMENVSVDVKDNIYVKAANFDNTELVNMKFTTDKQPIAMEQLTTQYPESFYGKGYCLSEIDRYMISDDTMFWICGLKFNNNDGYYYISSVEIGVY